MNQFLGSLALWPVTEIINRLIANDPHISARLLPFRHKMIEIVATAPSMTMTLQFEPGGIKLGAIDCQTLQLKPDARIDGKAADLLELLTQSDKRPLANTAISIAGDAELVQEVYNTLNDLDLDWEDYLAPLLGDVMSNELGQIGSAAKTWTTQAGNKLGRNLDEYLKGEASVLPDRAAVENFSNSLDQLKLNIDRLSARAELLHNRLNRLTN
jgi:ubiquinone biosynthesis protein UbiJ